MRLWPKLVLLLSTAALGADWTPVTGKAELRAGQFLNHLQGYPDSMGQAILSAQTSGNQEQFHWKLNPTYLHNIQDLQDPSATKGHLRASEVMAEFATPTFGVSAGLAPVNWGVSDGLTPANPFRAFDFGDPLFPRELSQPQVGIKLHPGEQQDVVFELLVIPRVQVDLLPLGRSSGSIDPTDSRWGSILPVAVELGESASAPLRYRSQAVHGSSPSDVAARLRFLQVSEWDYSIVIGQARRRRAVLGYRLTGDANNAALPLTVTVRPYYARSDFVAADASGTWGEFGVRLEVAQYFVRASDREVGYDSFQSNFGIDRLWDGALGNYDLYVNLTAVVIKNDKSDRFLEDAIDLALTESYSAGRVELRSERWVHGVDYLVTVRKNSVTNVYSKHDLTDAWQIGFTASFVNGREGIGLGRLAGDHRLIGNVVYLF